MNQSKVGVVGLGYVGLPVAVAFGKHFPVIGFDINEERITTLKQGYDTTKEVEPFELLTSNVFFTTAPSLLSECDYIIVAVPTPLDAYNLPYLEPILKASKMVGQHIKPGATVIFESTVYPGLTEEECLPLLERFSHMKAGTDFFIGYSPERINPGDKQNNFTSIMKVVAGMDELTTEKIAQLYRTVVKAGVHKAPSIKVAEAAKVIENTQRDINIAFMNEVAMLLDAMDIDTKAVLDAASTKWNFLPFTPGLVGGHCIGVDPYYLAYKAKEYQVTPKMILSGRDINNNMANYMIHKILQEMKNQNMTVKGAVVTILGITFKPNVPDIRNTQIVKVIHELKVRGMNVQVHDSYADKAQVLEQFGIELMPYNELMPANIVVLATPHQQYIRQYDEKFPFTHLLKGNKSIMFDVKHMSLKAMKHKNYKVVANQAVL